jgi:anti-anti-sigma regulatory factor
MAVFRLRCQTSKLGTPHRLPNMQTWLEELDPSVDVAVLDLCDASDLESAGAEELCIIADRMHRSGKALVVAGVDESRHPTLRAAGLNRVMPVDCVTPDLESALKPASERAWRLAVRAVGGAPRSGSVAWTFSPAATLSEGVGDETLVQPGEARVFRVDLAADGELGIGLQSAAEVLDCALLNARHELVAEGCQQFGRYRKGTYWLRVEAPADVAPMRFRPVVFGLKGADIDVPDEWLRDFFRRVPPPATSSSEVSR